MTSLRICAPYVIHTSNATLDPHLQKYLPGGTWRNPPTYTASAYCSMRCTSGHPHGDGSVPHFPPMALLAPPPPFLPRETETEAGIGGSAVRRTFPISVTAGSAPVSRDIARADSGTSSWHVWIQTQRCETGVICRGYAKEGIPWSDLAPADVTNQPSLASLLRPSCTPQARPLIDEVLASVSELRRAPPARTDATKVFGGISISSRLPVLMTLPHPPPHPALTPHLAPHPTSPWAPSEGDAAASAAFSGSGAAYSGGDSGGLESPRPHPQPNLRTCVRAVLCIIRISLFL